MPGPKNIIEIAKKKSSIKNSIDCGSEFGDSDRTITPITENIATLSAAGCVKKPMTSKIPTTISITPIIIAKLNPLLLLTIPGNIASGESTALR